MLRWFQRLIFTIPAEEATFLADHPQRFVLANQATPQIDSLRKSFKNRP